MRARRWRASFGALLLVAAGGAFQGALHEDAGLLLGRVAVSPILIQVQSATVTLAASILMVVTTYLALQTRQPNITWVAVFCAGVAMAPVFPTTLAMVGDRFPKMTATALGIVITSGWLGLAVWVFVVGAADAAGVSSTARPLHATTIARIAARSFGERSNIANSIGKIGRNRRRLSVSGAVLRRRWRGSQLRLWQTDSRAFR